MTPLKSQTTLEPLRYQSRYLRYGTNWVRRYMRHVLTSSSRNPPTDLRSQSRGRLQGFAGFYSRSAAPLVNLA